MKTLYGSTDTNERQQLVGIEPGDGDKGCCTGIYDNGSNGTAKEEEGSASPRMVLLLLLLIVAAAAAVLFSIITPATVVKKSSSSPMDYTSTAAAAATVPLAGGTGKYPDNDFKFGGYPSDDAKGMIKSVQFSNLVVAGFENKPDAFKPLDQFASNDDWRVTINAPRHKNKETANSFKRYLNNDVGNTIPLGTSQTGFPDELNFVVKFNISFTDGTTYEDIVLGQGSTGGLFTSNNWWFGSVNCGRRKVRGVKQNVIHCKDTNGIYSSFWEVTSMAGDGITSEIHKNNCCD